MTAEHTFTTKQLTPELIEHWRQEPGLGVTHLDNVLAEDPNAQLIQLWVGNEAVACLVVKHHRKAGCIVDLISKQEFRGQGYGGEIALKGFDKLINKDNHEFIQLNVICHGAHRRNLTSTGSNCLVLPPLDGGGRGATSTPTKYQ